MTAQCSMRPTLAPVPGFTPRWPPRQADCSWQLPLLATSFTRALTAEKREKPCAFLLGELDEIFLSFFRKDTASRRESRERERERKKRCSECPATGDAFLCLRLRSVLSPQGMTQTEQKQRDNTSLFPSLQTLFFVYEKKHSTGIRSGLSLGSAAGLPSRAVRTVRAGVLPNFF